MIMIQYFFLILIELAYSQVDFMVLSMSDNKASAFATYTFEIYQDTTSTIPQGSNFIITFPTDYQNVLVDQTYNCSAAAWVATVTTPTITCSNVGLLFTISNAFNTSLAYQGYTHIYQIVIENIPNPTFSGVTSIFNGKI